MTWTTFQAENMETSGQFFSLFDGIVKSKETQITFRRIYIRVVEFRVDSCSCFSSICRLPNPIQSVVNLITIITILLFRLRSRSSSSFFAPGGLPLLFFGGASFLSKSSGAFSTLGAPNLFFFGLPGPRGQFINSIGLKTVFAIGINVGRGSGVIGHTGGGVMTGDKDAGTGEVGGGVAGDQDADVVVGSGEVGGGVKAEDTGAVVSGTVEFSS